MRDALLTAGFTNAQFKIVEFMMDWIDHLENRVQDKHERLRYLEDQHPGPL